MYRKLLENPIATDLEFIGLFTWVLLKANHEPKTFYFNKQKTIVQRGEFITSMQEIAKHFKISRSKAYRLISILESEHILKHEGNTKYTVIKIHNYSKYQSSETQNETQTIQQTEHARYTNKNDKNVKNILDTNKLVSNTSKKDMDVDYILEVFEKTIGHKPTDKSPRNMAYVFKRQINKLISDLQPYVTMEFKDTVNKSFAWYDAQNELKAQSLNTIRRNIVNILFENTRKKYLKEVKAS